MISSGPSSSALTPQSGHRGGSRFERTSASLAIKASGAFAAGLVPRSRSRPIGLRLSQESSTAANPMPYSTRASWWSCSAVTSNALSGQPSKAAWSQIGSGLRRPSMSDSSGATTRQR
jgi:hypothetical protein